MQRPPQSRLTGTPANGRRQQGRRRATPAAAVALGGGGAWNDRRHGLRSPLAKPATAPFQTKGLKSICKRSGNFTPRETAPSSPPHRGIALVGKDISSTASARNCVRQQFLDAGEAPHGGSVRAVARALERGPHTLADSWTWDVSIRGRGAHRRRRTQLGARPAQFCASDCTPSGQSTLSLRCSRSRSGGNANFRNIGLGNSPSLGQCSGWPHTVHTATASSGEPLLDCTCVLLARRLPPSLLWLRPLALTSCCWCLWKGMVTSWPRVARAVVHLSIQQRPSLAGRAPRQDDNTPSPSP